MEYRESGVILTREQEQEYFHKQIKHYEAVIKGLEMELDKRRAKDLIRAIEVDKDPEKVADEIAGILSDHLPLDVYDVEEFIGRVAEILEMNHEG